MADQLSQVFEVVEVEGVLSGGLAMQGAWVSRTEPVDDPLKVFAVARGHVRLATDGLPAPLELHAGDVAVLNGRSWLELRGGPGTAAPCVVAPPSGLPSRADLDSPETSDVVFGGRIAVGDAGHALLAHALPPIAHIRADGSAASPLRRQLDLLLDEAQQGRVGSTFAIRQHAQLLLLEIIRACISRDDLPPGSLRLLADHRLRPAVALMHDSPERNWTLPDLARASTMSRTTFAERFRRQAGVPPLTYLTRWRMLLAQRALHTTDTSIGTLAAELGYSSESAFTTAFTREAGESPLRYRRRSRATHPGEARPGSRRATTERADATGGGVPGFIAAPGTAPSDPSRDPAAARSS